MSRINGQLPTIYTRVCDVSRRQKIKQTISLDRDFKCYGTQHCSAYYGTVNEETNFVNRTGNC